MRRRGSGWRGGGGVLGARTGMTEPVEGMVEVGVQRGFRRWRSQQYQGGWSKAELTQRVLKLV